MGFLADLMLGSPASAMQSDMRYGANLLEINGLINQIGNYLLTHEDKELETELKKLQILAAQKNLGIKSEEDENSNSSIAIAKYLASSGLPNTDRSKFFRRMPFLPEFNIDTTELAALSRAKKPLSLVKAVIR
jgi:hypothetical protein